MLLLHHKPIPLFVDAPSHSKSLFCTNKNILTAFSKASHSKYLVSVCAIWFMCMSETANSMCSVSCYLQGKASSLKVEMWRILYIHYLKDCTSVFYVMLEAPRRPSTPQEKVSLWKVKYHLENVVLPTGSYFADRQVMWWVD